MKKFLRNTGITAAFLALSLGVVPASAADREAPSVLLNDQTLPLRTMTANGETYIALRDFWVELRDCSPESIKWYPDQKVIYGDGLYLFLNDQTYRKTDGIILPLEDALILRNGTTYASLSFFQNTGYYSNKNVISTEDADCIRFQKTIYERTDDIDVGFHFPLTYVDEKTGLPDFESYYHWMKNFGLSNASFDITTEETAAGEVVYTYVSKENPDKGFVATAKDGFVTHILDNDALYPYLPR